MWLHRKHDLQPGPLVFAFSYLVLSYRIEQIKNNLPEDTYKCRLDTVNIVVCLFNVVVLAIVWIFYALGMYKDADIIFDIS